MKLLLVIFAVQIGVCLCQQYTSRYDNLNLDMILSNKRVLNNYVRCILDEGPCTPEGRALRQNIPDALRTNCSKCTDSQRNFVTRGARFLMKNSPNEWSKISNKYDIKQGQISV